MTNLRVQAEKDQSFTLEGDFGLPVELMGPDAKIINTDINGNPLVGQVMFDYVTDSPETGQPIVVNEPVVTLRISSLSRVPQPGEKWTIKIPTSPSTTAPLETFNLDSNRPPEGGLSIGYIRLYPRKLEQS